MLKQSQQSLLRVQFVKFRNPRDSIFHIRNRDSMTETMLNSIVRNRQGR
jgi:hypothetical protein